MKSMIALMYISSHLGTIAETEARRHCVRAESSKRALLDPITCVGAILYVYTQALRVLHRDLGQSRVRGLRSHYLTVPEAEVVGGLS